MFLLCLVNVVALFTFNGAMNYVYTTYLVMPQWYS